MHPPGPPVAAPTQAHSTGLDPCPAHRAGLSGPMQLMTQNARTAIMRPTSRPPLSSGAPPTADWGQTRLNHPLTAHTSCPHDGEDTPTHLFEQRSQTPLTWPSRTSLPTPPTLPSPPFWHFFPTAATTQLGCHAPAILPAAGATQLLLRACELHQATAAEEVTPRRLDYHAQLANHCQATLRLASEPPLTHQHQPHLASASRPHPPATDPATDPPSSPRNWPQRKWDSGDAQ